MGLIQGDRGGRCLRCACQGRGSVRFFSESVRGGRSEARVCLLKPGRMRADSTRLAWRGHTSLDAAMRRGVMMCRKAARHVAKTL